MLFLLLSLVAAAKIPFEEQALVAGTKWNLSNLLFLDIYEVSVVEILVLTSLDHLIFVLNNFLPFMQKQATLMRRSTVLSLPPQLVFPKLNMW